MIPLAKPDLSGNEKKYLNECIDSGYVTHAGAAPSLEGLVCLKLVREATAWTAHHDLVLAILQEALNRDEAYRAANLEGKLTMIRNLAVDGQLMSDHERKYLDNALVAEHLLARVRSGDQAPALLAIVKGWKDKGLICAFTQMWADSMLKRLGELRAARG